LLIVYRELSRILLALVEIVFRWLVMTIHASGSRACSLESHPNDNTAAALRTQKQTSRPYRLFCRPEIFNVLQNKFTSNILSLAFRITYCQTYNTSRFSVILIIQSSDSYVTPHSRSEINDKQLHLTQRRIQSAL